jgi:hypothetical protein
LMQTYHELGGVEIKFFPDWGFRIWEGKRR